MSNQLQSNSKPKTKLPPGAMLAGRPAEFWNKLLEDHRPEKQPEPKPVAKRMPKEELDKITSTHELEAQFRVKYNRSHEKFLLNEWKILHKDDLIDILAAGPSTDFDVLDKILSGDKEIKRDFLKKVNKEQFLSKWGDVKVSERLSGAIHDNDLERVRYLLELGARASFNLCNIIDAIYNKNFEMVKLLVENGADVNVRVGDTSSDGSRRSACDETGGLTPLRAAIVVGNLGMVTLLLEHGAKYNEPSSDLDPRLVLLHLALERGNYDAVKYLLEPPIELNKALPHDFEGRALWYASIIHRDLKLVKLLVDNGARIVGNSDSTTDLNNLIKNGHVSLEFFHDGNMKKYMRVYHYSDSDGLEIIKQLRIALGRGEEEIKRGVFKKAQATGTKISDGLFGAIYDNDLERLRCLLELGANASFKQWNAEFPTIIYAIYKKNFEMVKLLVENGANVNVRNTPSCFHKDDCDYLGSLTPLRAAIAVGSLDMLKLLLEHGAKYNDNNSFELDLDRGLDLIQFALERGNYEIAKYLLEPPIGLNKTLPGDWDGTALWLAAIHHRNLKMVKLLVDNGAMFEGENCRKIDLYALIKNGYVSTMRQRKYVPDHYSDTDGLEIIKQLRIALERGEAAK